MLKKFLKFIRNVSIGVAVVLFPIWLYLAQPTVSANDAVTIKVDTDRMQTVVKTLSIDFHPRSFRHTENLNKSAAYIEDHFTKAGGRVLRQSFTISGSTYYNIRCFYGPETGPRQIIGAHYDSHGDTPGADDNASGVAGLIELAYVYGQHPPSHTVELVAYTLEEPPFFATKRMGSYYHAKATAEEGTEILGVIVLEMIGYYDDTLGSQQYPSPLFNVLYPNTGDFIAVIGKLEQRDYIKTVKSKMKGAGDIDVYSIAAPTNIPGVDFSDHRNYWEFGYDAAMVSDTAFYRNKEYHKAGDTWDRLDYEKMGEVVKAVLGTCELVNVERPTSNIQ